MRHQYRDDPAHCYAPLLGNGDLLFPMDAEGGITPSLPTPPGLPASALYRLFAPTGAAPLCSYGWLIPTVSYLGRTLAPLSVSTEFSTDEAIFSSVCRYADGITVEMRACALADKPMLLIQKRVNAPGDVLLSYTLKSPSDSPMRFTVNGDMLVGERPLTAGQEKLCLFSPDPVRIEARDRGGVLSGTVSKNESLTLCLFFADSENRLGDVCRSRMDEMRSYVYKTGENRLFNSHIAAWRDYWAENEFRPKDPSLALAADGAAYLLRCFARRGGSPLRPDHPHAPFGQAPSVDLRVVCALLHGGHRREAEAILQSLYKLLPIAEARFGGVGVPGASYPYYTDRSGWELLPADGRRSRVIQTADAVLSFYRYYLFTEDRAFLRERAFPVAKSAVTHLFSHAVKMAEGGAYVVAPDPLSDTARPTRPFLTSCAVAAALSAFAAMADRLSAEKEMAKAARAAARDILTSLPVSGGVYTLEEDAEAPGLAPLYLAFYDLPLDGEILRRTTLAAAATLSLSSPAYHLALLGAAYAAIHTSAIAPLSRVAGMADCFGFLPTDAAEGTVETCAVFLEGLYLSLASTRTVGATPHLYVAFGLDQDEATDGEFFFSLPIGGRVDGRIRGGRFVSIRLSKEKGSSLRTATLVMPKWLYAEGAAVAVKKTERGGVLYLSTVAH